MSKIGFPGSPSNGREHNWTGRRRKRKFTFNSSQSRWNITSGQRTNTGPIIDNAVDVTEFNDATGLVKGFRGIAKTVPTYEGLPTGTDDPPVELKKGDFYFVTGANELYMWTGENVDGPTPVTSYGSRGIFAGGYTNSQYQSEIRYLDIATTGTTTNFGNLTSAKGSYGDNGVSNGTRGIFGGGRGPTTAIDYITIATPGDAANFGSLTQGSRFSIGSASNGDHGLFGGGYSAGNYNNIDHIVPATTSDSTNFGTLAAAARDPMTGDDNTYALFADDINGIDYFTFDTTGTATNFGTLTAARSNGGGTSDDTRTVFAGGWVSSYTTTIDYVTTATPGNAANFGALTIARGYMTGITDGTWGMWAGGAYPSGGRNHMDYVTIQTLGSASTWGTWPSQIYGMAGTSGNAA